jgi:hypothetical protein
MTERKGDVRPADPPAADMVVHKGTRDCPMIEPHPRAICGIVLVREENQRLADEARRRASGQTGG